MHGQRSLAGYSPWNYKESDMTEQLTLLPNTWSRNCVSPFVDRSVLGAVRKSKEVKKS